MKYKLTYHKLKCKVQKLKFAIVPSGVFAGEISEIYKPPLPRLSHVRYRLLIPFTTYYMFTCEGVSRYKTIRRVGTYSCICPYASKRRSV